MQRIRATKVLPYLLPNSKAFTTSSRIITPIPNSSSLAPFSPFCSGFSRGIIYIFIYMHALFQCSFLLLLCMSDQGFVLIRFWVLFVFFGYSGNCPYNNIIVFAFLKPRKMNLLLQKRVKDFGKIPIYLQFLQKTELNECYSTIFLKLNFPSMHAFFLPVVLVGLGENENWFLKQGTRDMAKLSKFGQKLFRVNDQHCL